MGSSKQRETFANPLSAITRVLHLPELLELILLNLSPRDLLLSQRASRSFHSTITTSPRLQKSLFLLPDLVLPPPPFSPTSPTSWTDTQSPAAARPPTRPNLKPSNNHLLLRAFPGGEYPTIHLHIEYRPTPTDLERGRHGAELYQWNVNISFPCSPAGQLPASCPKAVHYPEASWRRMYLCQPPCTELYLARRHLRSSNPAIVREGGITMGDFVEECTKVQTRWHESYVSSDGDWHFEGRVRCSVVEEGTTWLDLPKEFAGYVYSRTSRDGIARDLSEQRHPRA